MSTAVFTSFLCLLSIILLAISLLIECSKQSSSNSDESTKEIESKSSSSSAAVGSDKKSDVSTPQAESREAKPTTISKPPPKTPAQSLRKEPAKPSQGPPAEKQKDGKKIEGKTVMKAVKKDEAMTVQVDSAVSNLIQAAKTTKLPPPKKENAPPSDPGDGNYEDVNLAQAAPEAPKRVVTVDPTAARFPTSGGKATFTVLNTGTDRIVIKVKCSNNRDYRIKPVFAFLDPGGTQLVWVVRMAAPPKDDKMVIQWTVAPPNMVDGPSIFKVAKPLSVHSITVPLIGVEGDITAQPSQAAPQGPGTSSMVKI